MRNILLLLIGFQILAFPMYGQLQTKPIQYKHRTLQNGLNVVSVQDNSSPTVTIHLYYDVGAKNDPQGLSGFAHMFEHMMFKSTKNMKSEMLDRLTEDVGGFNNATTRDDFTNYFEVVPSHYLETLLWAEADRMVNLNVDEANFNSERDVVKEEFRQRILASPYGMLFGQYLDILSYKNHPYKRPSIGNLDELNAATVKDANEFYRTYYRPDNAYLIVVGDFEQSELDKWTDKYFGVIAKAQGAIPRVTATEPDRTTSTRHYKTAPNVPFPAVAITYLAPPSKHADIPALQIAEAILSTGESSRLYQSLIYNQQIAQDAFFMTDVKVDKGLMIFYATAAEGKTPDQLEKAILTELAKLQSAVVSANELEKAKNQMITSLLRERETSSGKASAIERAVAYMGDVAAVNTEIQRLQNVTAADVKRVMKQYFTDNNKVVIYYEQKSEQ